ncbi:branched-chain amino acid ABC transporter substrate-binding protein [Mesorhizobium sp. NZP2077]|uniref:branched-chain amino acid ABC transporter substrate-binding protein n=1 Tax=Mesorhizobium sp. NZP2077 TaxID=2483404 RepID=UPI001553F015|nr:branched-chain amino acid ABC transporter substrate-binding protein [Mesorhizobium sp. NZP2077]QKC83556.1 branched-chain amino acid ABC transporter substrate-binding protein [Mesorhizobium sp. NZP2077]QKD17073.1 branched-chain amino acid ABC transporter substrate-binding protein [Mesorhizobium sp. NZP2077]
MVDGANNPSGRKTVKIGVVAPLSGKGAKLGLEMAQAVELAIEDANASRDGPDIVFELVRCDDKGDESEGNRVATALIEDNDVLGVVGHYNSNVTLAVAQTYCDASMPLVSPIVSNPRLTEQGWSNVFRFTNRDDETASAIADHLSGQLKKRRAVVVKTDTVYGQSMSEEFVRAFEKIGGTAVREYVVEEGTTEFGSIVGSFPENIDLVFYGGTFEGAPLLKAMRAAGLQHLLATGDGCWDVWNFLEPTGEVAERGEGVLVLSACPEIGMVAGSSEFASRYADRFGPVGNYAVNCYDAATVLIEAIVAAVASENAPTRRSVLSALQKTQHQGIAYPAPVKWDGKQDNVAALTALHVADAGQFRQVAMAARPTRLPGLEDIHNANGPFAP